MSLCAPSNECGWICHLLPRLLMSRTSWSTLSLTLSVVLEGRRSMPLQWTDKIGTRSLRQDTVKRIGKKARIFAMNACEAPASRVQSALSTLSEPPETVLSHLELSDALFPVALLMASPSAKRHHSLAFNDLMSLQSSSHPRIPTPSNKSLPGSVSPYRCKRVQHPHAPHPETASHGIFKRFPFQMFTMCQNS